MWRALLTPYLASLQPRKLTPQTETDPQALRKILTEGLTPDQHLKLIEALPESQRSAWRHRCAVCAFEAGYELGRSEGFKAGENHALALLTADARLDRETVRAAGTDPTALFSSVLGEIGFDAVGDIDTKVVSFYRTDLTIDADPAAAGVGDWVFIEQVDETAAAG